MYQVSSEIFDHMKEEIILVNWRERNDINYNVMSRWKLNIFFICFLLRLAAIIQGIKKNHFYGPLRRGTVKIVFTDMIL